MLLTRLGIVGAGMALALAGCQVRYDDAHARRRDVGPAAGESALPSVRLDESGRVRRVRRDGAAAELGLTPSVRERRLARAMAEAQAEMFASGPGNVTYGYDGSASQLDKVRYIAQAGALRIDYEASPELNRVDGEPHALVLVVYHLAHTAAFEQLARTGPGLRRLLEAEPFDPSVKGVERHFVQPGVAARLLLNRADEGRYVALVAGYATPEARTSVFVSEYGLGRWVKSARRKDSGPTYMYRPLPMHMAVRLGLEAMAARNTGLVNDSLQGVHELLYRDARYLTFDDTFLPELFSGKKVDMAGEE